MAIGINDLDDDLLMDDSPIQENIPEEPILPANQDNNPVIEDSNEDDVISAMLKQQGINDPNEINYEDDNGQIQKFSFNELPMEDQLNILKGNQNDYRDADDLYDDEVQLINYLRSNKLSPDDYAKVIAKQAIDNYTNTTAPSYQVDDLSDDDIFLLDLKSRVPDIEDDDAIQALDSAKQNESLFTKQVNGIRAEYQQREQELLQQQQAEQQARDNEQLQQFTNQVVHSINSLDQSDDFLFTLQNNDKQDLYDFIVTPDATGMSAFSKALNDPNSLVKMSWYALHGEEAFNQLKTYFESQIKETHRNAYAKGFEDGKNGHTTVIFDKPRSSSRLTQRSNKRMNINDLD